MINCKQQGHRTNPVKYLCIYQHCNKQRFSCDMCLQENIHNHHKDKLKYFVSLNCSEDVISAYYMKNNIMIADKFLENIIKNQIITIDEARDDCTLNNKYSLHKTVSKGLNIAFSNNRKLMVTWAQNEQLKMWRNCKMINKMKKFISFEKGIFSEDDLYFYIGHENMIEKFDVQQNFKLVDRVKLGFEPFSFINKLKVITSNIVLGSMGECIFRVDLQLKKPTLKLNLEHRIRSLDYQKKRQVILSYTDDICIWEATGNLILKNNGNVLSKITSLSSYFLIASFIGDEDRIITINYSGIIIWFIDYYQRMLILNKIIQSPSMIYITQLNIEKNQINLIRQNDYLCLSLTDFKYKVKKHKAQIKWFLDMKDVNYYKEIFVQNYRKNLKLDQLVAIRGSFNKL